VFEEFRETITLLACSDDCEVETRIDAEGRIRFRSTAEWESELAPADLAGFIAEVITSSAQDLFSGTLPDCPVPTPPADEERIWELRTHAPTPQDGGQEPAEMTDGGSDDQEGHFEVNVSGCSGGAVDRIGARLEFLRTVYRPADGGN
jgi:hypothetical protein